jgi:hypothetical protein
LIEESWGFVGEEGFYREGKGVRVKWEFAESVGVVEVAMNVRKQLYSTINDLNSWKLNVEIDGNEESLRELQVSFSYLELPLILTISFSDPPPNPQHFHQRFRTLRDPPSFFSKTHEIQRGKPSNIIQSQRR